MSKRDNAITVKKMISCIGCQLGALILELGCAQTTQIVGTFQPVAAHQHCFSRPESEFASSPVQRKDILNSTIGILQIYDLQFVLPGNMAQPGIDPSPGQERTVARILLEQNLPVRPKLQEFGAIRNEVPDSGTSNVVDVDRRIRRL